MKGHNNAQNRKDNNNPENDVSTLKYFLISLIYENNDYRMKCYRLRYRKVQMREFLHSNNNNYRSNSRVKHKTMVCKEN